MSTIGTVWRRARITLGMTELQLADGLKCSYIDIALAEQGDLNAIRKLNEPFYQYTGVDLYVLAWCLLELPADLAVHAAPLAEALRERLRQLGRQNQQPADWSAVRRQVAGMRPTDGA